MNNTANTIPVGDKKVPVSTQEIDIFKLKYYPENPRLNYILSKFGKDVSQDEIDKQLWEQNSTKELFQSIKSNGGLIEEIWVQNDVVVEGNSRLCAYRHLYSEASEEDKAKWQKIRSKVILEPVGETDLFLVLGTLHIRGKAPWNPYEKASYIYKMIHEQGMSEEKVAEIVGMQKRSIQIELKSYEIMRYKYLPKISSVRDEDEELNKFSMFEEFYKQSDLQKMIKESPDVLTEDKFVEWVAERRVTSAAYDIKQDLAPILKHKPARKKFLELDPDEAINEAKNELYSDHPENADSFFRKIKEMTEYINQAEVGVIKEKIGDDSARKYLINQFVKAVQAFDKSLKL